MRSAIETGMTARLLRPSMTTTMRITGMTCGGCETNVVEALEGVDGVDAATADHESDEAVVEGDADPLDLIAAVPEQYEVASTA